MVRSIEGKHPSYFEAILQLRDIAQDVVTFVEEELARVKLPVAKVVELKNGLDYYLADNEVTKQIGKKLQQKFGGQILVTASLQTKKDDKELYRVTVLYRGVPFVKGDTVEYKGDSYVVKILGKDVMLQEVKTGKKVHVKYKDIGLVKKI